jgi:hypothetical protein
MTGEDVAVGFVAVEVWVFDEPISTVRAPSGTYIPSSPSSCYSWLQASGDGTVGWVSDAPHRRGPFVPSVPM